MWSSMTEANSQPVAWQGARGLRRSAIFWTVGILALGTPGLWLLFSGARTDIHKVAGTLLVTPRALTVRLRLAGKIEPGERVTLVAPFGGTIKKTVHEGQQVSRGEVLVVMDTADLEVELRDAQAQWLKATRVSQDVESWAQGAEVAQARRRVSTARLALNETKRRLQETRRLLDRGIVPKQELDTYVQQEQMQRLDVAAAEAERDATVARGNPENRQIARLELANAESKYFALKALRERDAVTSPFRGIVVRIQGNPSEGNMSAPVQNGTYVNRGQALLGIASLERLTVETSVDEVDVNRLHVGQKVDITADAFQGLRLIGSITDLSAQSLPGSSEADARYALRASVTTLTDEQRQGIRIGMTASLSVVLYENSSAIVLPASAIRQEAGRTYVLRAGRDGYEPTRAEVTLGAATEDGVEVRSGLEPGTRVLAY
jgi:HlyD family secretion protein